MYPQLLILVGLIYNAFSFIVLPSKVLISTRLDPIVQPGVASSHVHNIVGGNLFNATYSLKSVQSANCGTSPVTADQSAYWAPAMYFMNKTTNSISYTRISSSFNICYYPRGDPGSITVFPDNFKMLAGNRSRNTYNASSLEDQAVSWVCLDNNNNPGGPLLTPGFPPTNCPDGIKAQIFFPSCWDGTSSLESGVDPTHFAYPVQSFNNGTCPSLHPTKLVSLLLEQVFNTSGFNVDGDNQSWILANGDVTGYSYHADFWNGWNPSVLQSVIDHCYADTGDGDMQACPALQHHINEAARDACQLDPTIQIPDEDVGLFRSIPALPGNNPPWPADQGTPPVNSSYIGNVSLGRVGSLNEGVGLRGTRPISFNTIAGVPVDDTDVSHWESRGCIADTTTGRALEGVIVTDEPEMNLRKCALLCESRGYSIAGLEFGHNCYCDNALRNGAHMDLVSNVRCGTPCAGNPYENCGGSEFLVILTKDGVNSAQIQRLNSYFVLTSSLMCMFLMTLL